MLERKDHQLSRDRLLLTVPSVHQTKVEGLSLDVRRRDLFLSQLADKKAALEAEAVRLQRALQATEDEVVRWRLKYDSDMKEANDVIKRLRKMVEDRDDEIRLLRLKREEELAGGGSYAGASRVGYMAERLKELTLRNRELEELLEKMGKDMADGAFASTKRPETSARMTGDMDRGIGYKLTMALPDQQTEINGLRVEKV